MHTFKSLTFFLSSNLRFRSRKGRLLTELGSEDILPNGRSRLAALNSAVLGGYRGFLENFFSPKTFRTLKNISKNVRLTQLCIHTYLFKEMI